ncbi:MAG: hypothetical protein KBB46_01985, partial [Candidatus Pacebacteria bacterium]|nr:hypothetical protein [Candidatus Paceibacterota bacterium]
SASHHIEEITRYVGRRPDTIIMNVGTFPDDVLELYKKENELPIVDDLPHDTSVIRGSFADVVVAPKVAGDTVPRSFIRHDSMKIATAIRELL